jgi:hypothetical protein
LLDLVSRELTRQKLSESLRLSEESGLSSMTTSDIRKEIKATRKHAKNRS